MPENNAMKGSLAFAYAIDSALLLAFGGSLIAIVNQPAASAEAKDLVRPVIALVALTAGVWLLMVVVRNTAIVRGAASLRYYQTYNTVEAPSERIERSARAFMNLLEVPILFYVLVLLMLETQHFDQTQVTLAWLFVTTRALHAAIHVLFNYLPLRFAAYVMGCITLAVMWTRFGTHFW